MRGCVEGVWKAAKGALDSFLLILLALSSAPPGGPLDGALACTLIVCGLSSAVCLSCRVLLARSVRKAFVPIQLFLCRRRPVPSGATRGFSEIPICDLSSCMFCLQRSCVPSVPLKVARLLKIAFYMSSDKGCREAAERIPMHCAI